MTEINRPLTDDERNLMNRLAIQVCAAQTGKPAETVAAELDDMAANGELTLEGDANDVYLKALGTVLVHTTREWLAWHATHPGEFDAATEVRPIPPDDE